MTAKSKRFWELPRAADKTIAEQIFTMRVRLYAGAPICCVCYVLWLSAFSMVILRPSIELVIAIVVLGAIGGIAQLYMMGAYEEKQRLDLLVGLALNQQNEKR